MNKKLITLVMAILVIGGTVTTAHIVHQHTSMKQFSLGEQYTSI